MTIPNKDIYAVLDKTNDSMVAVVREVHEYRKTVKSSVAEAGGAMVACSEAMLETARQNTKSTEEFLKTLSERDKRHEQQIEKITGEMSKNNSKMSEILTQLVLSNQRLDQIDGKQTKLCEAEIQRDKRIGRLETRVELQDQAAKLKWGIFGTTATLIAGGVITIVFKVWGGK
jgi:chromosome segregation ATPase